MSSRGPSMTSVPSEGYTATGVSVLRWDDSTGPVRRPGSGESPVPFRRVE